MQFQIEFGEAFIGQLLSSMHSYTYNDKLLLSCKKITILYHQSGGSFPNVLLLIYTTRMRRLFAHFCRRVCEFPVTPLPAVPMQISVSFVPALNTVDVRSFVLSPEKKLLVR
jgi:hypothetical protein